MTSSKQMTMKIISSLSRWQIAVAVGKHVLSLCLCKIFCNVWGNIEPVEARDRKRECMCPHPASI